MRDLPKSDSSLQQTQTSSPVPLFYSEQGVHDQTQLQHFPTHMLSAVDCKDTNRQYSGGSRPTSDLHLFAILSVPSTSFL